MNGWRSLAVGDLEHVRVANDPAKLQRKQYTPGPCSSTVLRLSTRPGLEVTLVPATRPASRGKIVVSNVRHT